MLNEEEVFRLADERCKKLRMWADPKHYAYSAPETIPGIQSSQVKAVIHVLVKLFNEKEANGS